MNPLTRLPLLAVLLAAPLLTAPDRQILVAINYRCMLKIDRVEVSGEDHRRFVQREIEYYLGQSVMNVDGQGVLVAELYHVHPIIARDLKQVD